MPIRDPSRYPANWSEIATAVKEAAGWKCTRCHCQCRRPNETEERPILTVHHADYDPGNNDPSNLIPLCAACHLWYHCNRTGNIVPGQLKLDL